MQIFLPYFGSFIDATFATAKGKKCLVKFSHNSDAISLSTKHINWGHLWGSVDKRWYCQWLVCPWSSWSTAVTKEDYWHSRLLLEQNDQVNKSFLSCYSQEQPLTRGDSPSLRSHQVTILLLFEVKKEAIGI
jgi:hypothetical protein